MARLTNPAAKVIGISVNTKDLKRQKTIESVQQLEQQYQLPACDPLVNGAGLVVDNIK